MKLSSHFKYPATFKPLHSLEETHFVFKVLNFDDKGLLEFLIEVFDQQLQVDLYSRLKIEELQGNLNRVAQANYMI